MKFYTGIGSRRTPDNILKQMHDIAVLLSKEYILRSGGANGADTAFESGANNCKEIYLPWKNFNNNSSQLYNVCDKAIEIAQKHHPRWNILSDAAKKLMGRNVYQILGKDLNTPSQFVLCYTLDGCESHKTRSAETGGTGLAISLASLSNIPIFNMANDGWLYKFEMFLFDIF